MTKKKTSSWLLPIMALGVVFGDIGTSPLYTLSTAFSKVGLKITINSVTIQGIASLIIWSLLLVVTLQFVIFLMKIDNAGEGGVLALVGLIKHHIHQPSKYKKYFIMLGILGVALYFGDSTITPAISILSAVQGLSVISSKLSPLILPITILIVIGLFVIQKKGTSFIGDIFGPIMLIWFLTIGLAGLFEIIKFPSILLSLLPTYAINLFIHQPIIAFLSLGIVVLAVTGAEALYADLGHFGQQPIKKAWLLIVLPALISCYLGESAIILHQHYSASNPLFYLFPSSLRIVIIILATTATVIASQAVISGTFSLIKQAIQLNLLPKIRIIHTSDLESGQIYIALINFILMLMVLFLVLFFQNSAKLANAYGIAVSGTILIDALLYLFYINHNRLQQHKLIIVKAILIVPLPLLFFVINLQKILTGGWFPVLIAVIIGLIIYIYSKGESIITRERRLLAQPTKTFVQEIDQQKTPIKRLPGVGIYIGHHQDLTPLALHACINQFHEIHQTTIIVSTKILNLAHNHHHDQPLKKLSEKNGYIYQIDLKFGYHDQIDIPKAIYQTLHHQLSHFEPAYFISLTEIILTDRPNMPRWQKQIFRFISLNAITTTEYYHLPIQQTIQIKYPIPL